MNHYTSGYIIDNPEGQGGTWNTDSRVNGTKVGIDGKLIGERAESPWLYVYPKGMRGILNWIDKRYNHPLIYVFENGVSVPNENQMKIAAAVQDNFRINFYKGYIENAIDAITLDGVNLGAYFGWSLMDNFEWADGYSTRFGMTYVDYANNQQRYIKDSIIWYS